MLMLQSWVWNKGDRSAAERSGVCACTVRNVSADAEYSPANSGSRSSVEPPQVTLFTLFWGSALLQRHDGKVSPSVVQLDLYLKTEFRSLQKPFWR